MVVIENQLQMFFSQKILLLPLFSPIPCNIDSITWSLLLFRIYVRGIEVYVVYYGQYFIVFYHLLEDPPTVLSTFCGKATS